MFENPFPFLLLMNYFSKNKRTLVSITLLSCTDNIRIQQVQAQVETDLRQTPATLIRNQTMQILQTTEHAIKRVSYKTDSLAQIDGIAIKPQVKYGSR